MKAGTTLSPDLRAKFSIAVPISVTRKISQPLNGPKLSSLIGTGISTVLLSELTIECTVDLNWSQSTFERPARATLLDTQVQTLARYRYQLLTGSIHITNLKRGALSMACVHKGKVIDVVLLCVGDANDTVEQCFGSGLRFLA